MAEIVIDTNVLVMVDKPVTEMDKAVERDCILRCQSWLEDFLASGNQLVVDSFATHAVFSEYRRAVRPGGVAEDLLN